MTINSFKSLSLLLLCAVAMTFASCKKDLSDKIVGEWEVSSWVEDGEELIGLDFTTVTIEFDEPADDEGDVTWKLSDGTDSETLDGTYEVDVEDGEIKFTFDGFSFTLEVEIDGDELEMDGSIDGSNTRIKAERD